ncbi:hypothetical protein CO026_00625 [Candidatus Kaiserbacteria bacterium CG_4_9_14_0_2_um_filter_41_32]|uniref:Non-canonical purine NTP pyrophosphatase n=1 Tax=Candidatus Kaiserbacteria bacterium CG_4_9_14_0_2_um_filter_41_32 TaxID=1974601 RepID=A0A2M8FFJ8_9BACT|nr:hypothetical protein [bacterium]PIZ78827.1 MAG: hypothetical protein COY01_03155 [Candidatus Pacebacteria bacterium CG_4_10_14_0_2_um_filter_40_20]PJC56375.1 MAG: hypothetical protein CO026_00625 [Candidatus Kaiserbacteria bacterium CG_4_9_14_0_2_um_filter_41_32]
MKISYVTGNIGKFENAQKFFNQFNIDVQQLSIKVEEIQSGDSLEIAIAKAEAAYAQVKRPLFVNDASWIIPALGGFPGPFMKFVNQWFKPQDFINLMTDKEDRRIILKDSIVYINESGHTVFTHEHVGEILNEVATFDYKHPTDVVVSLSKDHSSIAEEKSKGGFFIEDEDAVWKEFVTWLQSKK